MTESKKWLREYIARGERALSDEMAQEILDYITNLQEEKDDYKNKFWEEQEQCEYLQDRIDKAIEEIKKRSTKEVADLYINLLQGKSDE